VAFWLTYELGVARDLTIRIIQADEAERPPHALNGPCATGQEILARMDEFFWYDEAGFVHLAEGQNEDD